MVTTSWLQWSCALALAAACNTSAIECFVSVKGDDANPGNRRRPFRTLEAARDAIRESGAAEGATVWIREGRYARDHTFELTTEDSGSASRPVVYRAFRREKVVFDGGALVPPSAFRPVVDESVQARLPAGTADFVRVADLRELRLTNYGTFGPRGYGRRRFPAPMELFVDGQPMEIARWPNGGEDWIAMGEVLDPGRISRYQFSMYTKQKVDPDDPYRGGVFRYLTPRVERWTQAEELHITGIFAWGYAEDTVQVEAIDIGAGTLTTMQPHMYGFGGGKQPSIWKWYGVNLLEEIDRPGEYYIDRQGGLLYLYPAQSLRRSTIQVSLLDSPFVRMDGVSNVVFQGVTFENARGDGIRMSGAEGVEILGCTLRNLGGLGISIQGRSNRVVSCDLYQLGAGGVGLSGGHQPTLTPADNEVRNCDIHHLNRWYRNYQPAVSVSGVGHRVAHNHFHHMPGQAVILSGNDHRFEYNEMDHVISDMSDQGAIYMGRDPSSAGHVYRYNFVHHTATTHEKSYGNSGFFFDDGASGQHVFGNVFYKTGKNGAVKYHGGQFNEFVNNVVIDCPLTVKYLLWNEERWTNFINHADIRRKLLERVNILEPPFSTRYPKLARIYETPYTRESHVEEHNYVTTVDDPVFANARDLNFEIRDLEAVRRKVPGFEPIPFGKIGLYRDPHRRKLP